MSLDEYRSLFEIFPDHIPEIVGHVDIVAGIYYFLYRRKHLGADPSWDDPRVSGASFLLVGGAHYPSFTFNDILVYNYLGYVYSFLLKDIRVIIVDECSEFVYIYFIPDIISENCNMLIDIVYNHVIFAY